MNEVATEMVLLVGAGIAAIITGIFSLLQLIISKEMKISEFRQEWINALRQEMAEYLAEISNLTRITDQITKGQELSPKEVIAHIKSTQPSYYNTIKIYYMIRLRVNSEENTNKMIKINSEFLEILNGIRELFNAGKFSEAMASYEEYVSKAFPLLKEEWERVKRGEVWFRMARRACIIVLLCFFILVICALWLQCFVLINSIYISNGS